MNPALLATHGALVFAPVRHHSPACARAIQQLIRELRPVAILIEGPADFNDRLDELALPHQLPIAIYSYVRLDDATRRGAFYPFCEHSPEWVALQTAREVGATVRFIDLPWRELATAPAANRYADGELRASPYIPALCEQLGVEDFDSMWDQLFEIEQLSPAQLLERVHHFCYHLRASGGAVSAEDLRREAFMAEQIRSAQAEFNGSLLVVTGGFHSSALYARLHGEAPPEGDYSIIDSTNASQPAAPPTDIGIALTPFTDTRLDSLTGYEAGMPSPGFYRAIWRDRAAGRDESYRTLLAEAVLDLRERGQIASTADLIAVETSAQALAALRGHSEVWRQDLIDAIIGALIKEAIAPDTRHPLLDALLLAFRGNQRGVLAEGVALPPLVTDIRQQLAEHRLEPHDKPRVERLDLAKPDDLERSRILHQLRTLDIHGFARRGGSDFVGRADLVEVWEEWQLQWSPDFDANCIEASIYGASLADAAHARLLERANTTERNAEQAALILLDACLMGLHFEQLLAELAVLVRQDADFFNVSRALRHVLYLFRYDTTLGAFGRSDIGILLLEIYERALWLLEMLGQPQGQDRELIQALTALVQTFEACEHSLNLDRTELADVLRRTAAHANQRPLVRGAATGALWTLGQAALDQVRADLRSCAAPDRIGDFLTGLFALARETAQRHPELVASVDELISHFDEASYFQALPAMRLAFSFFTPREKHYLAHTLLGTHEATAEPLPTLEVGIEVAARALALEGRLLETLARFGIRGEANDR